MFIQQGGRNKHEHICESLELFAAEVMDEFKADEAEREAKKAAELAPFIEAAFARKHYMRPLADAEIPRFEAYGNLVAEVDLDSLPEANRQRAIAMRRLREVVRQADEARTSA